MVKGELLLLARTHPSSSNVSSSPSNNSTQQPNKQQLQTFLAEAIAAKKAAVAA